MPVEMMLLPRWSPFHLSKVSYWARELGKTIRARLEQMAPEGADVRGLGPMLAIELPDRTPDRANAVQAAAREGGLILLTCGLYGNVIRLHVPLVIEDGDLGFALNVDQLSSQKSPSREAAAWSLFWLMIREVSTG